MKNSENKIIFIPFYAQAPQHRSAASARIRAEWPAKYLNADIADKKTTIKDLSNYNFVIFQKCYSSKFYVMARAIKEESNGDLRIGLDLCDPIWLERPEDFMWMSFIVDFFTVPTEKMKEELRKKFNDESKKIYVIPDGHDLEYYNTDYVIHDESNLMRYIWYGNSGTIKSLQAIMPYLEHWAGSSDTLTIIADKMAQGAISSEKLVIKFVPWDLETVNQEVKKCNIALNPRLNTPEYAVKSNNKTAMAYILGLPCIDLSVDKKDEWNNKLINLKLPENRIADVKEKRQYYIDNFRMEKIAEIWEKVLAKEVKK